MQGRISNRGVASTGTSLDFFCKEWSDAGKLAHRGPFYSTAIEKDMPKKSPYRNFGLLQLLPEVPEAPESP
jgi:hypothetical protein